MRLYKASYILRQDFRAWKEVRWKLVATLGFVKSGYDESLYIRTEVQGEMTIIVTYVDGILIVEPYEIWLCRVVAQIDVHGQLEYSVKKILGMWTDLNMDSGSLLISSNALTSMDTTTL